MLDHLAISPFDLPLPPARPVAVEERLLLSGAAKELQGVADYILADARSKLDQWKQEASRRLALVNERTAEPAPARSRQAIRAAEKTEQIADVLSIETERLRKRIRREVKRDFSVDPTIGSVTRSFGAHLLRMEEEKIEVLLEGALFLRAWAAERDDRGPVESFEEPDALTRALLT